MVEYNCCGTQQPTKEDCSISQSDMLDSARQIIIFETPISEAKRQKLPLHLNKKVLSPSRRFNTTVSDAEIEKSRQHFMSC